MMRLIMRVHRRIFNAADIARAGHVGRLRTEKIGCSLPGDSDCPHTFDDDVEIEITQTILILHVIDSTDINGQAEPFQIRLVEQDAPLIALIFAQEFDADRLAGRNNQLAVADFEAGFFQQPRGLRRLLRAQPPHFRRPDFRRAW